MLIGVIGIGGIAQKAYLPVLAARAGLDLILQSRSAAKVQQSRAAYRIPRAAGNLDDLVCAGPRAAFVLTPDATHYEIVRRLLEAGIDVFVEKPATQHAAETQELAELADRLGRVFMVGFNRRYAPLHRRARDLLAGKQPDFAWLQKDRSSPSSPTLFDLYTNDTIHQIDLLRFFCGEGHALSTRVVMGEGVVAASLATIALESGGIATVATSFRAGAWRETYELSGGGQTVAVDAFMRVRQVVGSEERRWQETYASSWRTTLEARGFTAQIEHFLECVESRAVPETSAWESVKTQRLLEEMLSS